MIHGNSLDVNVRLILPSFGDSDFLQKENINWFSASVGEEY